ncbi:hypothetical protein EKO29_12950 [Colwellia sp. Arc7-635]|uniref:hypothetical protein n=1 Tax=Colwellia sp. Arc7-635 TaxID=2497879 RepID=UPI000F857FC7|nr:hypothetical protein [Colwellia sp. Arc7-635]AZQ84820.1 hypothetical protein EKO29_12950 [Colwellia sp. Arc7-635]
MKVSTLALSLISLSLVSLSSSAGEYETTVGLGHEYGGVLGAQLAYKTQDSKYYASAGLIGFSAGLQTTFSENSKHAFGFVAGKEEFHGEDGFFFVTYDYHLDGFSNNGFVIGTGIGITREDEGGLFADLGETVTSTAVTLNIGYKF